MIDYQTALSELDEEEHYLFSEERRLMHLAFSRGLRRWGDLEEAAGSAYESAIGNAGGDAPRGEFQRFLQRIPEQYRVSRAKIGQAAIIVEWHIYKASWMQPDKAADYFANAVVIDEV